MQRARPPSVDVPYQFRCNGMRLCIGVGASEPDEDGIRVAVDGLIATVLHEGLRLLHDLVSAQGHGRHQLRVEEAAFAGAQHSGERVHQQLQRLRQGLVLNALGLVAAARERGHDFRQAMLLAREQCSHRAVDGPRGHRRVRPPHSRPGPRSRFG